MFHRTILPSTISIPLIAVHGTNIPQGSLAGRAGRESRSRYPSPLRHQSGRAARENVASHACRCLAHRALNAWGVVSPLRALPTAHVAYRPARVDRRLDHRPGAVAWRGCREGLPFSQLTSRCPLGPYTILSSLVATLILTSRCPLASVLGYYQFSRRRNCLQRCAPCA